MKERVKLKIKRKRLWSFQEKSRGNNGREGNWRSPQVFIGSHLVYNVGLKHKVRRSS